uniref:DDE Tnp4 domain-containing protein n=1 Tax=Ananas comosus var. bracteatus TaxID=296719 RepID=A0A6V7QYU1_ANACO
MGPVRGFKKRKRAKKKSAAAAVAAMSGPESGDWWDGFSRRISGPLSLSKDLHKFESVFKISRKTFNYICSLVKDPLLAKTSKNFSFSNGETLTVDDQVAVALRRLSSGESLQNVGLPLGLSHSTVSQVTWRFVEAMEQRGLDHLKWPNSQELEIIKSKFEKIQGLPNCCGAIDTTHVAMRLPSAESNSKVWLDSEENYSMVLQAIVDPQMRFRDITTGWPGSLSESTVLKSSGFFKLCKEGLRLNGKTMDLVEGTELREYIVGDPGYPLLPWLITPYRGNDISRTKEEFNRRHCMTRMVAQRALARFKDMWRILQGGMWRADKHRLPRIILVCCLLHNIVIDLQDEVMDEMPLCQNHDIGYRQQFCDAEEEGGLMLRDNLSQYLSGRLPP